MTATTRRDAAPLPRPLIRTFWALHRFAHRATGGRFGLKRPIPGTTFGMLRLATTGRRSGRSRVAIVGYFEDGANLVTLAMNGWGEAEPAWWLNLQANPDAEVSLPEGTRAVRARAAVGEERDRLWAMFRDYPGWGDDIQGLAERRPGDTAVVVLEPRPTAGRESDLVDRTTELAIGAADVDIHRADAAQPRRRFRPRHLWVVPGLAVAVYAGMQSNAHGFGPLLPLAFGLGPHAGWLLALGGIVAGSRVKALGIPVHNVLHHPLLPVSLAIAGFAGLLSPWWLVAGGAWLGHIVIGWAIGDGHTSAHDYRPARPSFARRPFRRPTGAAA
jgi:deazaflavin-dependent oxidoreductase (nitroreductase family)